jgi:hypothetical protein
VEWGGGRMMERVNLIDIYYKHICKYHSISSCTTIICQEEGEGGREESKFW